MSRLFRDRSIGTDESRSEFTRHRCSTADTPKGRSIFALVKSERRRKNKVAKAARRRNRGAYVGR